MLIISGSAEKSTILEISHEMILPNQVNCLNYDIAWYRDLTYNCLKRPYLLLIGYVS